MKVADLYIRVSTDEQADKGYSQRDQEERLRKYCELNFIQVRKVIFEDHSAKTFNRPAWAKLLLELKKRRGQSDLVLFTKWDRFSRNAGDAYQMINVLRRYHVEPQAIEQPLDLSIPENKIMLAFYLATPEVENDRRALNVFNGMRRARKEGRYMGPAPVGYANKITEDGKKYIAPKADEAEILKWAFQEIAFDRKSTQHIWHEAKQKGLRCSKNNFWWAIRNPLYCGKMVIPKYKDEEAMLVKGQHEPIISEVLFYQVQDVLDGRKKKQRVRRNVDGRIPLRGFLICPKCGRLLTGSGSKSSKGSHYYYYHCNSECGIRFRAEQVNKDMLVEIRKHVKPLPKLQLCAAVIASSYKKNTRMRWNEIQELRLQLEEENTRLSKAREFLLNGKLDADDYRAIKVKSDEKMERLEARIAASRSERMINIAPLLDKAIGTLSELDTIYEKGDVDIKRKVISSIFPGNLVYTGAEHRTRRLNEAVELISLIDKQLRGKKNGTSLEKIDLYQPVIPLGVSSIVSQSFK